MFVEWNSDYGVSVLEAGFLIFALGPNGDYVVVDMLDGSGKTGWLPMAMISGMSTIEIRSHFIPVADSLGDFLLSSQKGDSKIGIDWYSSDDKRNFGSSTMAETLPASEGAKLVAEVTEMSESFNRGDVELLIRKTHPSVFKHAGGEEAFMNALEEGLEQLMAMKLKFESFELDPPGALYSAGEEDVCFLPKVAIMELNGQRYKSTSYMVAVRDSNGNWKYLDGAVQQKKPELLWSFLPELPKDVKLPPNTIEVLEEKEEDSR